MPLRGRVCCHHFDMLIMPPAAHFFTQKSVEKALRGHPLKPHFTKAGNRLVISCNGTPSKKTSCVCPARTLLHIFLAVSAFASGCLLRRSSLQDTCKTRHTNQKAEVHHEVPQERASGANASPFQVSSCRKQILCRSFALRGIPKGERLRRTLVTFFL